MQEDGTREKSTRQGMARFEPSRKNETGGEPERLPRPGLRDSSLPAKNETGGVGFLRDPRERHHRKDPAKWKKAEEADPPRFSAHTSCRETRLNRLRKNGNSACSRTAVYGVSLSS